MDHLFEGEMVRISSLNSQALVLFSAGGFLISTGINIVISSMFAAEPLTDAAKMVLRYGSFTTFVLGALCYGFGWLAVHARKSDIKRIKDETRTELS
jgi:hypothetical protein